MTLHEYSNVEQGTDEWNDLRRGIVTASVVGQLISVSRPSPITGNCPECGAPAGKPCLSRARKEPGPIKTLHPGRVAPDDAPDVITHANNDTSRALTTALVAERITGWTEPTYVSNDMLRGNLDEPIARDHYAQHYAPVTETGFMIRDDWGFRIGYSPDGLAGEEGLIEVKSRRQKTQLHTILTGEVPAENMAQLQCGLLVSGRAWIDYLSFSAGMPMWVHRVYPDPAWHAAILNAAARFEQTATEMVAHYTAATEGLPTTERIDHFPAVELKL